MTQNLSSTRRDFTTRKWKATFYLNKGFGADSVSVPGWPGKEQILAERSAGGLWAARQDVLSALVEGGGGVVEGACEMIKENNEDAHSFWMGWDIIERQSAGTDWMNEMQWVEGRQRRSWLRGRRREWPGSVSSLNYSELQNNLMQSCSVLVRSTSAPLFYLILNMILPWASPTGWHFCFLTDMFPAMHLKRILKYIIRNGKWKRQ